MLLLNAVRKGPYQVAVPSAWDALERLLKELQGVERAAEQIRITLRALRESLDADVVFWYPGKSRDNVEIVGEHPVSAEWCRKFGDWFLGENPNVESNLVQASLGPRPEDGAAGPVSVAMAQVSRSKAVWIVALSFNAQKRFTETDARILGLARRMLLSQRQHALTYSKLKEALLGLVSSLTATIDAKDPYTCGHSERVARIAVRLGEEMKLPGPALGDLYLAGLLHDIGKVGIEDCILRKPTKLTDEEFAQVQEHPVIGDRIVSSIKQFEHLRPGVRSHHERIDGLGYPDGLCGAEIPLMARILAVADSCDAMMSCRPYRRALPARTIDQIMTEGAGKQWDQDVVRAFMACRQELYQICQKGIGASAAAAVEHAANRGDSQMSRAAAAPAQPFAE
jgi:HD-GYP domain-containing protein (c-di-GMP phosphodiesterase class II)